MNTRDRVGLLQRWGTVLQGQEAGVTLSSEECEELSELLTEAADAIDAEFGPFTIEQPPRFSVETVAAEMHPPEPTTPYLPYPHASADERLYDIERSMFLANWLSRNGREEAASDELAEIVARIERRGDR